MGRCAGKPAREIALTDSEILACGSSEIIYYVDSEITAVPAVVKKNGSPKGCGTLSLLPKAAISLARQSQFRSVKAEFHSSRRREFHFALQSEHLPYNFPFSSMRRTYSKTESKYFRALRVLMVNCKFKCNTF